MKKQTATNETRRDFLRTSVAVGAGATVAAAVPGAAMADTETVEAKPKENYRLTRHIADYYKSTL